jgi:dipeptidase D
MAVLEHLEPKGVFSFFEQLCAIPHGSGNTKAISDFLVRFAEERGLDHVQDALNNVIIIKEATPGYEAAEPVILQGHMDMVCEKAPDCAKDMAAEGLDLAVEGDTVFARGTTLGGDDGIAVAMALAVLDAQDLPHPRIEAVFTVDEETGMDGAFGIDVSPLTAKRMINIDSEAEGIFTVSCAGDSTLALPDPPSRETSAS